MFNTENNTLLQNTPSNKSVFLSSQQEVPYYSSTMASSYPTTNNNIHTSNGDSNLYINNNHNNINIEVYNNTTIVNSNLMQNGNFFYPQNDFNNYSGYSNIVPTNNSYYISSTNDREGPSNSKYSYPYLSQGNNNLITTPTTIDNKNNSNLNYPTPLSNISQSQPLQQQVKQSYDHSSTRQATSNDPCAQIAHVLQCYQQGGQQPEFVKKAIESLVKKLKDKRTELDALITAVTSAGKTPSICVTIPRSLDGRLQVAGKKGVPHVVYAQIWRWPNVNKSELQKLPICEVSNDNQELICINPYHYERVVSSSSTTMLEMKNLRVNGPSATSPYIDNNNTQDYTNHDGISSINSISKKEPFLMYGRNQTPSGILSHLPEGGSNFVTELSTPIIRNHDYSNNNLNNTIKHEFNKDRYIEAKNNLYARYDISRVITPQIPWPDHWCSISYYEFNTQIGETFKVSKDITEVIIDGGMNTSDAKRGRFCIGALSNVHRCEVAEKARLYIGKGVRLKWTPSNCVYLESMSTKAVFVRSYYLDFENNLVYGSTVHKFLCGTERKLFDLKWAYAEMCEQTRSAEMAVLAQARAVAGLPQNHIISPSLIEHAGTGVDDLRRVCCTISISFVKGWGPGYTRNVIKETPCWVEIQLTRPLQLLDRLLKQSNTA
uniref:Mothers against decapentaplegic homolog n=1 Tax=Strongyloides stercoralis TaxID=6248 RepID=A0A8F2Z230_STRER|nr:SMAD-4B [Strongyloides stercoralis]